MLKGGEEGWSLEDTHTHTNFNFFFVFATLALLVPTTIAQRPSSRERTLTLSSTAPVRPLVTAGLEWVEGDGGSRIAFSAIFVAPTFTPRSTLQSAQKGTSNHESATEILEAKIVSVTVKLAEVRTVSFVLSEWDLVLL